MRSIDLFSNRQKRQNMGTRTFLKICCAAWTCLAVVPPAVAADEVYPAKPVRIIVPYGTGFAG
jgi:hypothetical protein